MPKLDRAQPPDYYYRAYSQTHHPAHWFHKRRLDFLASLVPEGSAVLDAGCGSGVLAWLLGRKGCFVTGVDNDAARLDFARRLCLDPIRKGSTSRLHPGRAETPAPASAAGRRGTSPRAILPRKDGLPDRFLEAAFVLGDLRQLDLSQRFDVVICGDVLEHFTEKERSLVIANLVRHVRPGGLLILSFPSAAYFALEPLWRLARRFLFHYRHWDDQPQHHQVGLPVITDCTAIKDGAICLGLVQYFVARLPKP